MILINLKLEKSFKSHFKSGLSRSYFNLGNTFLPKQEYSVLHRTVQVALSVNNLDILYDICLKFRSETLQTII